ncbi:hypothetical protein F2Q68_00015061 [Brassica cretica]|uniref:Reverse transcriptase zinc-binding domain-containing protein n=1 Tax=Brassica cretica TaxID=69181 RepID=A0A8S9HME9_BRACR|nr:hypothetical protein F2Q68_00015061 [Brassica cretica]
MLSGRVGDGKKICFWYDNWSIHGLLVRFIDSNGPLLMGIQDQSTVAEAFSVRDRRAPSRTRNPNISLLRATLRDWPHQAVPSEPDTFMWGPSNSCSDIFSTKKTWDFFRPRAETKEWSQMEFVLYVPLTKNQEIICSITTGSQQAFGTALNTNLAPQGFELHHGMT